MSASRANRTGESAATQSTFRPQLHSVGRPVPYGTARRTLPRLQKASGKPEATVEDMVAFTWQLPSPALTEHWCHRLFDVSKQVVGQLFCHGLNVLISDLGSHHSAGNACSYYFLNIFLDTTLGELFGDILP